jgi:DNA-binding transcriptional LysR family regulator
LQVSELREHSVLVPAEDSVVTARARALFKRHGLGPATTVSVGSGAAVRSAVLAGAGVGVTLASATAGDVAAGWMAAAPFPLPDGALDVWLLLSDSLDERAAALTRALVSQAVTATETA